MWESNPPRAFQTPLTGFEDRGRHQSSICSQRAVPQPERDQGNAILTQRVPFAYCRIDPPSGVSDGSNNLRYVHCRWGRHGVLVHRSCPRTTETATLPLGPGAKGAAAMTHAGETPRPEPDQSTIRPPSVSGRLHHLPAVHRLLASPCLAPWLQSLGRVRVRMACTTVLDQIREEAAGPVPDLDIICARVVNHLRQTTEPHLRRVINATGVVLHTGLGRAPLAQAAVSAVQHTATHYTNLELDLDNGQRGHRSDLVAAHLRAITGAEAALVVNNNAAAVLLVLAAVAVGREVVISRGELVEIGGSFRIPEVLAQSGAHLREVGTTNRTYARDYAAALGPETALLLKVHQSNFRILGFTTAPEIAELTALGHAHGIPVAFDMGSGALVPGLPGTEQAPHHNVRSALEAGADVVTFSGDKLLGGPQAGILCGRAAYIDACAHHPLQRALRVDKMTLAALEATLDLYRSGNLEAIPTLRMLLRSERELAACAEELRQRIAHRLGPHCATSVIAGDSVAGGGSLPEYPLPTAVVAVRPMTCGVDTLAARLRRGAIPVVARIGNDALLLDPRTLLPGDELALPELLATAMEQASDHG